jgi:micrococcal nuclease
MCKVLTINDGDTLGCDLNQNGHLEAPQERVRLIGIDAPEMSYSRKNKTGQNQPYALEATNYLKENTLYKTVYLEQDDVLVDKYGRQLAYIYPSATAKRSFNETLLALGYAVTLFIPPNTRYQSSFEHTFAQAQAQHLGLWKNQ